MKYFKQKTKPDDNMDNYLDSLRFKDSPIAIKGSSMLLNNKFFGDYDIYSYIGDYTRYLSIVGKKSNFNELYDEFENIIHSTLGNDDTYFMEFKVGNDRENVILTNWNTFNKAAVRKAIKSIGTYKYIQLEFIIFINKRFITVTSDYYFTTEPTEIKRMETLREGMFDLMEKKKYFKALKRIFNIYQLRYEEKKPFSKHNLQVLVEFFNSRYGEEYCQMTNINTIIKLLEFHKETPKMAEQIAINFKTLKIKAGLTVPKLRIEAENLNSALNAKAQEIITNFIIDDELIEYEFR
jgi:hypothetical protein